MTPAQTLPPPQREKKGKGALIAVIGGIAVLAAVGVGVAVTQGGDKKTDVVAAKGSDAPAVVTPEAPKPETPATPEATKNAGVAGAASDTVAEMKKVECEGGKVQTVDTRGHCCWGDQVWSEAKSKCLGAPTCPPGTKAKGEDCLAVVAAAPAKPARRHHRRHRSRSSPSMPSSTHRTKRSRSRSAVRSARSRVRKRG
jgi:hypothetical protein